MSEEYNNTLNVKNSGLTSINGAKKNIYGHDTSLTTKPEIYTGNKPEKFEQEKEPNHLKEALNILSIKPSDLARQTTLSRCYISRVMNEQIKIIQPTKIKIVKALSELSGTTIFPTAIFPILNNSECEWENFLEQQKKTTSAEQEFSEEMRKLGVNIKEGENE